MDLKSGNNCAFMLFTYFGLSMMWENGIENFGRLSLHFLSPVHVTVPQSWKSARPYIFS